MESNQPRLIQTFLPDGTFEGPKIIELSQSQIKAYVVPRLKIMSISARLELNQSALYFLFDSKTSRGYIGESENFLHRIKEHDQAKDWWDFVIAFISPTNSLEKSDVKYLESLAVERAKNGSMQMDNKTTPARNNIHEFRIHGLQCILDDIQLILISLGYDALSTPEKSEDIWYCKTKKTEVRAVFRGDKFVVLKGSIIDLCYTPSFEKLFKSDFNRRKEVIAGNMTLQVDVAVFNDNVQFRSPNEAGQVVTGRSINAWTLWKNESGQTMDEIMRKGIKNE